MRKTIFLAALAAAASMPTAAQAQAVPAASVVVVNTDRVYRECNACRTAQTSLQSQVTALQTRQRTLEAQLRPEGTAIQQAANALNGAQPDQALRTRVEAFQKKQNDAQAELQRGQQNLQSIQANVLRQIDARLAPAINQVMTARGANLAVDVGNTLAHGAALNVTTDVLAALNRTLPSVTLTPLPQQQQQRQQPQGR
ncbi:MAG: OmpH family outer membrane protein [Pseudomonadota bacterium]|nr:OmpH family outer membrane protein [Pseudomonadota bacterium]